jgi:malate dehydrogenase
MSRKKVTVVGSGFVGSTTAQRIVDMELADVVVTDILDGPPAGKALDMLESAPITRSDAHATGISTAAGDYSGTAGSDVVVITAGFPRKPGMSRDDLLKANYDVVKAVVEQIVKHSPNCIIIVVTNPLDAMVQAAFKTSGFPKNRVLGMAGVLDSERLRRHGMQSQHRECALLRLGWARRRHGSATAIFHRGRHPSSRSSA